MKKIAIALILFQLIGCAKQPAITTNQKDIKDIHLLQAKIETIEKERESYANEIFWNSVGAAVGIGIGVIAIIASVGIVINNRKSTNELTSEMEQLKQKVDKSQTTLKADNIEAINKKVEETEKNTNTITQELKDLQDVQDKLQEQQNEFRDEVKGQQSALQDGQNALNDAHIKLVADQKALRTEFGVRQTDLQDQLTALKGKQDELDEELHRMQDTLEDVREQIART
jgi:uncharacterized phage infection (PIP) family protein YhgE